ncbi:hypothetical protein CHS0354_037580 [Potamilus streckersoni]|uniref:Uncharacterized protein n=1 Tax=Potamilus streckersoni TaxID=2493646 RepID=A0AAE0SVV2_9BIVA|nr:hypothetical protein CHS0354_037580 [Potamilus streckersoni]
MKVHISYLADALRLNEKSVQGEMKALFRRITGQEKQNYFRHLDATLPSHNVGNLDDRGETDKSRQLKEEYNVKVAVLIDSATWNT